jgi:hypothetical protein
MHNRCDANCPRFLAADLDNFTRQHPVHAVAPATRILWLIALRREKVEITAWEFFRIGVIAMPVALIASLLLLWN